MQGEKLFKPINLEQNKLPPLVSIIIINFNGLKFLSGCLYSIFDINYPNFEVIFVDNNSSDGSVEYVKNRFGKKHNLKIIDLDKNYGYCEGCNIGTDYASGKYVVFLNMDIEVYKDWISEIISVFEKDKTIGAAQPKILFLQNKKRIYSMGHYLTAGGSWNSYVKYGQIDNHKNNKIEDIFIAHGSAITVKFELFKKIGMFDRDFFMYSEESDLCWRIWLSGHRVVLIPSSIVYHYGGGVAGGITKMTPLRAYFHTRNSLITVFKNYNTKNLCKYLPLIILRIYDNLVRNVSKNPRLITYYLIAIIDFFRTFNITWRKRLRIQFLIRCISDDLLFEKGLISGVFAK